ncbi:MAG TPA: transglycosylase SLT domain-containing protein [Sandaracinaceae bacterium LLY-WYZ-13_1]|nr:transglycosylase SLT domain-containing protein [Sandaracinaceae bacterium LLY-WYZ-13_1]
MFRRVALSLAPFALVAGLALVPGGHARADIYTYTDADGVVHYSNTPPERRRGVRRIRTRDRQPSRARARGGVGPRDRSPDRYSRYDAFIREAAALYQLPEAFIRAVIRVESDYHPEVVSHAGACGLMQLMPATAARMGVTDAFDPRQNILGGSRYLRILANQFNGDLVLTIAAYNAGEGAVLRYRGIPPYEETQRYVRRVLRWYYGFLEAESNGRRPAQAAVRRVSR